MASETYGNVVYGVRDIKITNAANSTQEDLGAATLAEFTPEFEGGILKGDDANKAAISYVIGGQVKFGAGEYSSAAVALMLGVTLAQSGTTPNEVTTLQINAGQRTPYFRVYAKALDDGAGDMHLLLYKVKIMNMPSLVKLENGNYRMSEFEAECFDDGTNGVVKILQNETAADLPAVS